MKRLIPILAVGLILRVWGLSFGLPFLYHQDEPIVVNHAMAYGLGDLNPHFFKIPPFVSYALFAVYGAYFLVLKFLFGGSLNSFGALFLTDPGSFYWLARFLFGALLGTASVYALYRFAKEIFGESAALPAASFLAVNFMHARDSHYVYADIPMVFFILLACHAACSQKPVRSALWAGAATAAKYIAAPVFFVTAAASFVKERNVPRIFYLALISFLTYAALNPFSFFDFHFFLSEIFQQASAESRSPWGHHLFYSLTGACGAPALIFAGAGVVTAWRGKVKNLVTVLLFPVIFYGLIIFFSQPYERYALPLVPFICLFAGFFIARISGYFRERAPRRASFIFLWVLASWTPLQKTIYMDQLASKTDTRSEAYEWFQKNVPAGSTVMLGHAFFSPHLKQEAAELGRRRESIDPRDPHASAKAKKIEWLIEAQRKSKEKAYRIYYTDEGGDKPLFTLSSLRVKPTEAHLSELGIQYFVRFRQPASDQVFAMIWPDPPEPVAVFSPYKDPAKKYSEDPWANVGLPFLSRELFSRKQPGPYLEIYRRGSE